MPEKKSGLVDNLAGKVKAAAGNIAGDRDLAEEGELQQAKGARADEASRLEAEAEQAADETRTKAELESHAVEQARLHAEIDEADRLDDIERQRHAEEARAASLADKRSDVTERLEEAEQSALDRQEQVVEVEEALAQRRADEIERQAEQSQRAADTLDAARRNIEEG
jgi:uncharacterized protein YjbJ (UPF0337 family)